MRGGEIPAAGDALRRVLSAAVPDAAKRRIDAVRNRRAQKRMAVVSRSFVPKHGLTVSGGPFRGMRYPPGLEATRGDLVLKLLGVYEAELHQAVESWQGAPISVVVNVGCGEGYYAVGFALALPDARVLAYDINPQARRQCLALAAANGVDDRVEVRAECTTTDLANLPERGVALFCDCEGCELGLLDPAAAPSLRGWRCIVELHDDVDPAITPAIARRFAESHELELIASLPPGTPRPELERVVSRRQALLLAERPGPMFWACLTPRAPDSR